MRGECIYLNKDLAYFIEEGKRYIYFLKATDFQKVQKIPSDCFEILFEIKYLLTIQFK